MVLQEWWWCYFCNFLVFKICFLVAKSGIFVHVQAGILFSLVVARIMQCLVIKLSLFFPPISCCFLVFLGAECG